MSDKSFTDELKTLAEAFSLNNRASNRLWIFLAALTLVVTGHVFGGGDGRVDILGIDLGKGNIFYFVCIVIFSIGNIAYISAHIQAYHCASIYSKYLISIGANEHNIGGEPSGIRITLLDAAHSLYWPNLNRLYPITHAAGGNRFLEITISIVKFPYDFLFVCTPLIGLFASYLAFSRAMYEKEAVLSIIVIVISSIPVFVSIGAALLLISVVIRWDYAALIRASS